ncbi:MAG: M15 family metallopeptidase [Nanoarchaeota archaeon]
MANKLLEQEKNKFLCPKVVEKTKNLLIKANESCLKVDLHSAYRDSIEQGKLYALGRTIKNPDGITKEKPMGRIITNSIPGNSWHNYGFAVDIVFRDINGNWTWNVDKETWIKLGNIGKSLGFFWGGDWTKIDSKYTTKRIPIPDYPHFEIHGKFRRIADAKKVFDESGLMGVWEEI